MITPTEIETKIIGCKRSKEIITNNLPRLIINFYSLEQIGKNSIAFVLFRSGENPECTFTTFPPLSRKHDPEGLCIELLKKRIKYTRVGQILPEKDTINLYKLYNLDVSSTANLHVLPVTRSIILARLYGETTDLITSTLKEQALFELDYSDVENKCFYDLLLNEQFCETLYSVYLKMLALDSL